MSTCVKCGFSDTTTGPGTVHTHHMNGDHSDNRPENLISLCAICHHTLHWGRWKLSDIGLSDVVIQHKHGKKEQDNPDFKEISTNQEIEIEELKEEIDNLKADSIKKEARITTLIKTVNGLLKIMLQYDPSLKQKGIVFVNSTDAPNHSPAVAYTEIEETMRRSNGS